MVSYVNVHSPRPGRSTRGYTRAPGLASAALTILALALACSNDAPSSLEQRSAGAKVNTVAAATPAESAAKAGQASKPTTPAKATAPSHGFNDAIAWRGFEEGFRVASEEQRPLMLVVHASWCSKCRLLKRLFRSDKQLIELSEQFVMVNVDQDEEPTVTQLGPDGTYLPRVLFFAPNGDIDSTLQNPNRRRFRYFYMPNEDLLGTMRRALERHGGGAHS